MAGCAAGRSPGLFDPPPRAREWLRACIQELLAELRADAAKRTDGTADRVFAVSNLVATLAAKAELTNDEREELLALLSGHALAKK